MFIQKFNNLIVVVTVFSIGRRLSETTVEFSLLFLLHTMSWDVPVRGESRSELCRSL
jgi:hypothetical protein